VTDNIELLAELRQAKKRQNADCTDDALAQAFAEKHANDLRYVAFWNKWVRWTGTYWQIDRTKHAYDLVRVLLREIAEAQGPAPPGDLTSARRVNAVHTLVQADRRLAAEAAVFDQGIDTFAQIEGMTINLLTGEESEPRPEDYGTIQAGTWLDRDIPTPLWTAFLARITDGDPELEMYLQRVAGYCMTGSICEECLFFLYGTGANGKGVYLETLAGIWGDYAGIAPMDLFMTTKHEQHPTGLAGLRGARLVVAQETEAGGRWSESRIKRMTGGGELTAKYMRGDYFRFTPQFKILIAGNHRPRLTHVDEAVRRRIHMIPFTVTIPEKERDNQLKEKLKAEWPGILAWALQGCLDWRETGLEAPQAVLKASEDYLKGEDTVGLWIDENCDILSSTSNTSIKELWDDYKTYCENNRESCVKKRDFTRELRARGYRDTVLAGGKRAFSGITLKPLASR
jgi:P4 family phage/plasmid primase-like protien